MKVRYHFFQHKREPKSRRLRNNSKREKHDSTRGGVYKKRLQRFCFGSLRLAEQQKGWLGREERDAKEWGRKKRTKCSVELASKSHSQIIFLLYINNVIHLMGIEKTSFTGIRVNNNDQINSFQKNYSNQSNQCKCLSVLQLEHLWNWWERLTLHIWNILRLTHETITALFLHPFKKNHWLYYIDYTYLSKNCSASTSNVYGFFKRNNPPRNDPPVILLYQKRIKRKRTQMKRNVPNKKRKSPKRENIHLKNIVFAFVFKDKEWSPRERETKKNYSMFDFAQFSKDNM